MYILKGRQILQIKFRQVSITNKIKWNKYKWANKKQQQQRSLKQTKKPIAFLTTPIKYSTGGYSECSKARKEINGMNFGKM